MQRHAEPLGPFGFWFSFFFSSVKVLYICLTVLISLQAFSCCVCPRVCQPAGAAHLTSSIDASAKQGGEKDGDVNSHLGRNLSFLFLLPLNCLNICMFFIYWANFLLSKAFLPNSYFWYVIHFHRPKAGYICWYKSRKHCRLPGSKGLPELTVALALNTWLPGQNFLVLWSTSTCCTISLHFSDARGSCYYGRPYF